MCPFANVPLVHVIRETANKQAIVGKLTNQSSIFRTCTEKSISIEMIIAAKQTSSAKQGAFMMRKIFDFATVKYAQNQAIKIDGVCQAQMKKVMQTQLTEKLLDAQCIS